jgi:hypothetical protein
MPRTRWRTFHTTYLSPWENPWHREKIRDSVRKFRASWNKTGVPWANCDFHQKILDCLEIPDFESILPDISQRRVLDSMRNSLLCSTTTCKTHWRKVHIIVRKYLMW